LRTGFEEAQSPYISASQVARVDTETWAATWMYCPNCGCNKLRKYKANRPLADFYCEDCGDEFELKSQSRKFGRKLANGAYATKLERLASDTAPHLLLMQYDRGERTVQNMLVVPKSFFVASVVEKRKPLKPTARRAGWVGSNILLDRIPQSGRIFIVRDGLVCERDEVIEEWKKIRFLERSTGTSRGWLVDVMGCVDQCDPTGFSLSDVYAFEARLAGLYPNNANVRPKIRQQLQVLRDNGYIEFLGGGRYRRR
jgi:type II restriction enzyme